MQRAVFRLVRGPQGLLLSGPPRARQISPARRYVGEERGGWKRVRFLRVFVQNDDTRVRDACVFRVGICLSGFAFDMRHVMRACNLELDPYRVRARTDDDPELIRRWIWFEVCLGITRPLERLLDLVWRLPMLELAPRSFCPDVVHPLSALRYLSCLAFIFHSQPAAFVCSCFVL